MSGSDGTDGCGKGEGGACVSWPAQCRGMDLGRLARLVRQGEVALPDPDLSALRAVGLDALHSGSGNIFFRIFKIAFTVGV